MTTKIPAFLTSRRQFLKNVLPASTLFCLGCSSLLAIPGQEEKKETAEKKHKFLEDSGMSFKDVYDFGFTNNFIPIMKNLEAQIGKNKFIELLKNASMESARQNAQNLVKSLPKNDFTAFKSIFKNLLVDRFWQHVLSFEIVEESNTVIEGKIKECLWAKTFRDADAADIGYAAICHGDYAYCQGFNPKIRMIRTKTLMQGHDICNHRWVWEG